MNFFQKRGFGKLRLSNAKKAISDFKKICFNEDKLLDLMIFYVEMGVEFTNQYGDIDERFYNSIESMYESVMKKINDKNDRALFLKFRDRLLSIVDNTDGIGWGFHDALCGIYYDLKWVDDGE